MEFPENLLPFSFASRGRKVGSVEKPFLNIIAPATIAVNIYRITLTFRDYIGLL